jgi:hypothetical protein
MGESSSSTTSGEGKELEIVLDAILQIIFCFPCGPTIATTTRLVGSTDNTLLWEATDIIWI